MREILVAAERADRPDDDQAPEPITFPIKNPDGTTDRELTAYFPGDGQIAALMATSASFSSMPERVAGAINFLVSVLGDDDHSYIVNRLFDARDPFGAAHVQDILEGLVEEWTGRPTKLPSGSTPSRRTGGRKSTQRTPQPT